MHHRSRIQRLAQYSTRHPRRVLGIWALVAIACMALTSAFMSSGLTSESRPTDNPESQQAADLLDERLPGRNEVDEIVIVRSEQLSVGDAAFRARVRTLVDDIRATGDVVTSRTALDPGGEALVSADGHATMIQLVLAGEDEDKEVEQVIAAARAADGDGFAVDITGRYTAGEDFTRVSEEDLRKGEMQFGLPAALIILLLVFGTLVGAAIPLTMAVLSIVVSLGLLSVVGQVFELNLFIQNMVVAMGLALGIDYSLFIVSRLREERHHGLDTRAAIMAVASTATRAVVFSGTAFSLAMAGMLLMPDTTLRSLGAGAIVVGIVSICSALTFHPALLMVLGDRVDRLRVPWLGARVAAAAGTEGRGWRRAVTAVLRRPALALAASCLVLVALASPVLGLKLGASGFESLPDSTTVKQGLIALERDFPSGAVTPVEVVVEGAPDAAAREGIAQLRERLASDGAFAAGAAAVQESARVSVLSVPLTVQAATERATEAVDRLRDEYVPAAFGPAAERVLVGGGPAESRDYFAIVETWLPIVIAFVLVLSVVLLTLAFRSVVVPLTAVGVNLLSVGAAYGILVLIFQEGVLADTLGLTQVERIDAWVPVFLFSVLFGLSMDYQVFLLSRIHERQQQTGDTREAIVHGVASTARLITGAALIIVVVFAGFATGDLVAFQQMGAGVAIALALDATLVRLVVIPAAMGALGSRNWYLPAWLNRLPKVQIEAPAPSAATVAQAAEEGVEFGRIGRFKRGTREKTPR